VESGTHFLESEDVRPRFPKDFDVTVRGIPVVDVPGRKPKLHVLAHFSDMIYEIRKTREEAFCSGFRYQQLHSIDCRAAE
jgi:hypothetical protein